jgi:hypothetical protein
VSRSPPGEGKAGPDAGSPLALRRKRLQGISSVAAGPCARVLSAGWNLHRDKTGFPSPKRRLGLEAACRRRLRVSPTLATPRPLAMGRGGGRAKGIARPATGESSTALSCRRCQARFSASLVGLRADGQDRRPHQAWSSLAPGGTAVPNLGHKHAGRAPAGLAWHGAAAPRAGASPAWEPPLASLPLRDKH